VYCSHHTQDSRQLTNHLVLLPKVLQPSLSRQHTVIPSQFVLLPRLLLPSLSRQHTVNPSLCAVTQCTEAITLKTAHSQPITPCTVTQCTAAISLKTAHGQPFTLCCYPVYCSHHSQDSTRSTLHFVPLPSVLKPSLSRQHTVNPSLCAVTSVLQSSLSRQHAVNQSLCAGTQCTAAITLKTAQGQPIILCAVTQCNAAITIKTAHGQPITLCLLPSVLQPPLSRQHTGNQSIFGCYPVYCIHHS